MTYEQKIPSFIRLGPFRISVTNAPLSTYFGPKRFYFCNFYHTACTQLPSTKLPVFRPYLENNHSIIHTTRLIYHLSIYLLQFYWSHPSRKPPHNVTAILTIQGNRMKSTINTLNRSTQTSHSVC